MSDPPSTQAPPLPHWESTPEDLKAATREIKAAIRARIEASGRTVEEVWAAVTAQLTERVEEIEDGQAARRDDLAGHRLRRHRGRHGLRRRRSSTCTAAAASSSAATSSATRRSPGTRASSTTSRATASSTHYSGPADDFFGSVGSRPEIYPVYWSKRADGGAPERPHGATSSRSSTTSGPTSPTACSGSTPTRTRSTPTASAAARPAPTPAAWAPTSTPARSTCG